MEEEMFTNNYMTQPHLFEIDKDIKYPTTAPFYPWIPELSVSTKVEQGTYKPNDPSDEEIAFAKLAHGWTNSCWRFKVKKRRHKYTSLIIEDESSEGVED